MALSAELAALELGRTGKIILSQDHDAEAFQLVFVQARLTTNDLGQSLVAETMES